ncbi:unnamed protein product [Hymenolepis diminuta]|uniref:BTB domain-containing protein n=1 Tax=Hymenolepis diminuta TaxID=6216 RepID=A0A0R3SLK1_HYMDI|nr:unnamed protein product [Hymenolepis diminuta]
MNVKSAIYTDKAARAYDCSGFEYLRKHKLYFDLKILVQNFEEILAHRVVLATRFPLLRKSLPNSANGHVYWTRFSREVVEAALSFAYTGSVEIDLDIAIRLFLFSYNIGCAEIRNWCVDFLSSRINQGNVSDIWSVANSTLNEQLMSVCLPTIQNYSEVLWKIDHFCSVTQPEGMSIVLNYPDKKDKSKEYSPKAEAFCEWIDNQFSVSDFKQRAYRFRRLLDIIDIETLESDVALNIPEFQSFSYLRQSVPYRDGCEITLLQNWICVLGGNTFWFFMTQKCPTFSILDLNDNEKFNGPPMTHDRSGERKKGARV